MRVRRNDNLTNIASNLVRSKKCFPVLFVEYFSANHITQIAFTEQTLLIGRIFLI